MPKPVVQLDPMAQRFLQGSDNSNNVTVHEGQQRNADSLAKQKEYEAQVLLQEASAYGDDLVRYVAMHQKNTHQELAWGLCLGLYCARGEYPGGGDEFDDMGDLAATDLTLAATTTVTDPDEIARIQMELPVFSTEEQEKAARFSEKFQEFLKQKKHQSNISNKQAAYGLGRAFHNLRRTFPADHGGSAAFDELARRAGQYFRDNT